MRHCTRENACAGRSNIAQRKPRRRGVDALHLGFLTALSLVLTGRPGHATNAASSTYYPRVVQTAQSATASVSPDREPVRRGGRFDWTLRYSDSNTSQLTSARLRLPRQGISRTVTPQRLAAGWLFPDMVFQRGRGVVARHHRADTARRRHLFLPVCCRRHTLQRDHHTHRSRHSAHTHPGVAIAFASRCGHARPRCSTGRTVVLQHVSEPGSQPKLRDVPHAFTESFTDGKVRAHARSRNTPSLLGVGDKSWFNLDGNKDSCGRKPWCRSNTPRSSRSTG